MDAEGLPFAAMGLAAPVVDHPLPVMGDVVPVEIPVAHVGPVLPPVAPVVDHPLPVMGDVVPVQIPVVHAGPILLPDAPVVDHSLPVMGDVVPVQIPVVHAGPVLLPDAPVVHPGPVLLPASLDVVPDPNANQPAPALPPLLDGPDLPVLPHHVLAALPLADHVPFLACDVTEENPNPWVQVERRRPPHQQAAHPVALVDSTGDVDVQEEYNDDEFEDAFWLTKITQYRVSRRCTKSRRRALVGVRSGPGVFVFNY